MALTLSGIRSWWLRGSVRRRGPPATEACADDEAPERGTRSSKRKKRNEHPSRAGDDASAADGPAAEPARSSGSQGSGDAARADASGQRRRRSARTYAREAAALLLFASALYAALALASYQADPLRPEVVGEDWVGPVGAVFAGFFVKLVGVIAWLIPLELGLVARPLLLDRPTRLNVMRVSGDVLVAVVGASLVHIALPATSAFGAMPIGGTLGELFGEVLRGLFSTVGTFLVGLTVVALILLQRATFSFIDVVQRFESWLGRLRARLDSGLCKVAFAWSQARQLERQRLEQRRRAAEPLIATAEQADAIIAAFADGGDGAAASGAGAAASGSAETGWAGRSAEAPAFEPPSDPAVVAVVKTARDCPTMVVAGRQDRGASPQLASEVEAEAETPSPTPDTTSGAAAGGPAPVGDADSTADELLAAAVPAPALAAGAEPSANDAADPAPAMGAQQRTKRQGSTKKTEPRIVDTSEAARTDKSTKRRGRSGVRTSFRLPTTDLLDPPRECDVHVDEEALQRMAKLLEKTLADYGVQGDVREIHPGPTVTTFEVAPAPGTKVSKVASLADDLALGLSRKVRIIAPIPGKNRVGFEVPNDRRVPVNLRELVEDRRFLEMKAPLPCVLGRNKIGKPVFADLTSMPHVIVAGATGTGKSVGLNVMLVSLLYRRTPEELRLLLVDPKVVELAPFDRIPHLLLPVVTDMKHAANALKWAVDEMERRYQLFATAGTRNIKSYNAWAKRVLAGKAPPPPGPKRVKAVALDGSEVEVPAAKDGSDAAPPELLPYIVIVVEEFADLMLQQGKNVEAAVARLAQKARAAGMHVIVATQRPSVDVITGLIKANFPTRIAYRVAQKVDSRTILDDQGAEHLLGQGDMLVKLNGTSDNRRIQCPFCSEEEVQRVTDMLRGQGEPDYDEGVVQARDASEETPDPGDAETDPLYDQAVRIVAETRRCSTSWIQRKLGVGYNRAAKIVETMQRNNIVGPPNGSKDREIFISAW